MHVKLLHFQNIQFVCCLCVCAVLLRCFGLIGQKSIYTFYEFIFKYNMLIIFITGEFRELWISFKMYTKRTLFQLFATRYFQVFLKSKLNYSLHSLLFFWWAVEYARYLCIYALILMKAYDSVKVSVFEYS